MLAAALLLTLGLSPTDVGFGVVGTSQKGVFCTGYDKNRRVVFSFDLGDDYALVNFQGELLRLSLPSGFYDAPTSPEPEGAQSSPRIDKGNRFGIGSWEHQSLSVTFSKLGSSKIIERSESDGLEITDYRMTGKGELSSNSIYISMECGL